MWSLWFPSQTEAHAREALLAFIIITANLLGTLCQTLR